VGSVELHLNKLQIKPKTCFSPPAGIFQVMFSVITLDFFKLRPEQNGYLMAYFGVASMVSAAAAQIETRDELI